METILETLNNFQKLHPDVYIGGSISLILQNAIPPRMPKDVDIVSPKSIHIFDLFQIDRPKHRRIKRVKHEGMFFDLFINPKARYIKYMYNGNILKLSPIDEICEWKLKKNNIKKEKHIKDLEYCYG